MANSGELLINVVRTHEPKALRGSDQKVRGQVQGYPPSPAVTVTATGGEAEPNPSVIHPWNVVNPSSSPRGRPSARGSPMGRRVKDEGGSECRSVIERIGVEPRRDHPTRKRANFPRVSPHETVRTTGLGGRADDSSSLLVRPPAYPARQPRTSIVQVGRFAPHRVPRGALGEA
jgi:hypothetical protein